MANEVKKPAGAPKPASSPVKNAYLILYNSVSALLWVAVLSRTVGTIVGAGGKGGYLAVFDTTGDLCKWTQTLAGMEVLHSLLGMCFKPPLSVTG